MKVILQRLVQSVVIKLYNCKKCSLEIDRDINGARNIFLKNYIGQDEGL